jgi:hypothetical protein
MCEKDGSVAVGRLPYGRQALEGDTVLNVGSYAPYRPMAARLIVLRLQGNMGSADMIHTHQEYAHYSRKLTDPGSRPGFASTAVYFERLAQKETRDDDRRERLLQVADFYHSLAGIIPGIPHGYMINDVGLPVTRAERWKARAEECRTLADCFTDPTCRGQLRRLAQSYDRMAIAAE